MRSSLYDLNHHLEILTSVLGTNRSHAQLAKKLGYRSHRTIGMILRGQRLPSNDFLDRLTELACLSALEREYVGLLVARVRKPTPNVLKRIATLRNMNRVDARPVDGFSFSEIKDWYYLPLFEFLRSHPLPSEWRSEMPEISAHFRNAVPENTIANAIRKMIKLGILQQTPSGKWAPRDRRPIYAGNNLPSQSIRDHHRQMIERAAASIEAVSVSQRELIGLTLRFDPNQIAEAKNSIREFRDQFNLKFGNDRQAHVFQLNFQFFPHTDLSREMDSLNRETL